MDSRFHERLQNCAALEYQREKLVQTLEFEKAVNALDWRPDGGEIAAGAVSMVGLFEVK